MKQKFYEVEVKGYGSSTFIAESAGKARAEAWRHFRRIDDVMTFKQFLSISKVRRAEPPSKDGYDYIREYYGIDFQIGDKVRLVSEGSLTGKSGEVVYPGAESTNYYSVCLDDGQTVNVHPMSVEAAA